MTPSLNKKEPNSMLPPASNKNLPPKPVQSNNINNNISYKMPPKPSPLVPSKQLIRLSSPQFKVKGLAAVTKGAIKIKLNQGRTANPYGRWIKISKNIKLKPA